MQGDEERAGCIELSINNRQLRRMDNTPQGGAISFPPEAGKQRSQMMPFW
jgi:hypothetical protein